MKILLCHPGASWSVADVFNGYHKALEKAGHEIVEYALGGRIAVSRKWLEFCWKHSNLPEEKKPTHADTMFLAGMGILERALNHQPDWVLIISAMHLHPHSIRLMKRAGLRVAMLMTESPYDDVNQVQYATMADCIFTNDRISVARFKKICPSSHYLRHAYDPDVHYPHEVKGDVLAHDVVFVGTGFQERCELLRSVDWDGIDLGLYGSWDLLGSRNWLRKHLRDLIIPNDLAVALYQRAKIALNIHRTSVGYDTEAPRVTDAESVNPRVIELAACGVFCLSDWRPEMDDLFGDVAPRFTDGDSLQEMMFLYLDCPDDRARIAKRMCELVQGETFDNRVKQVIGALEGT